MRENQRTHILPLIIRSCKQIESIRIMTLKGDVERSTNNTKARPKNGDQAIFQDTMMSTIIAMAINQSMSSSSIDVRSIDDSSLN